MKPPMLCIILAALTLSCNMRGPKDPRKQVLTLDPMREYIFTFDTVTHLFISDKHYIVQTMMPGDPDGILVGPGGSSVNFSVDRDHFLITIYKSEGNMIHVWNVGDDLRKANAHFTLDKNSSSEGTSTYMLDNADNVKVYHMVLKLGQRLDNSGKPKYDVHLDLEWDTPDPKQTLLHISAETTLNSMSEISLPAK